MISESIQISASKDKVWPLLTDIEKANERITCIKSIEVLERPSEGLVGFKWKESREMFGKEAVETMWIIEASDHHYVSEAINCGCKYHSTVKIEELSPEQVRVSMSFETTPITLVGRVMAPMLFLMKNMIKKAFKKDLEDIKKIAEN